MGASFNAITTIETVEYTCGWCGRHVAANHGWFGQDSGWGRDTEHRWVYLTVCPNCQQPTYHWRGEQIPGTPAGDPVEHLPDDVRALYEEARLSTADGNGTAAVLVGRKVLMHVAVERGAEENRPFAYYVDWLVDNAVVTADMKEWVGEIRELGNEANHEIVLMSHEDATALLTFLSLLLRIVYEYPERGRQASAARRARAEGGDPGPGFAQ